MGKPELFSYLSAFVTIVLAIAVTNIIQSASSLLQNRGNVKWDARPIFLSFIIFLLVISEFFSVWQSLAINQISMLRLIWMLAVPTTLALLAYLVLPNEIPATGLSLSDFYAREHRVWGVLLLIATVLDFIRSEESPYRAEQYILIARESLDPFVISLTIGSVLLSFVKNKRWSWVGLLLLLFAAVRITLSWSIDVAGH